jgi:hypothetical protein
MFNAKPLATYTWITLLTGVLVFSMYLKAYGWGFWGHKRINRMAVFTLPPEMFPFYKKHIEFITEHAVDPDKRRYASVDEAPRHYIDLDHYPPNERDSLPLYWNDAVRKYTEDTLKAYGIVPWHVVRQLNMLTNAFKQKNINLILNYSADLGHYIADAHVPLHTTENYNGQLTNQHGIHGFWESRIPELNGESYDYFLGRARLIPQPQAAIWAIVYNSHAAVDTVLKFEAVLTKQFPADQKYAVEQRGATNVTTYSKNFSDAYEKLLDGMVEKRMRASIIAVGSFWYTAWVNAGKPNLDNLQPYVESDAEKKQHEAEDQMWRTGKPPGTIKGHDD